MNAYVASVIDYVKTTHGNEPEFVQTVEEVLSSISPIMDAHPEYEKVDLLKRMVEPERMFTFRVCWMDDKGEYHTNRGWRCQFNGAIGPYKGGLRFQKNVYEGVIKFLGFEQTFKNSPDRPAHGRRKGRLRLRSRRQVRRGSPEILPELHDGSLPLHRTGHRRSRW